MRDTQIDARKSEVRREDCLHCVVMDSIETYFREHGTVQNGQCVIDVAEIASKLTECVAEVICSIPDRNKRRRAVRFAHDALDANMRSQATGKLVEVEVPHEH